MDINSLTASKIKELRLETGKPQNVIAKELGMSPSAYVRLENGNVDIDLKTLELVANFYQLSVGEIISQKNQDVYHLEGAHGVAIKSQNPTFNYNVDIPSLEKAVSVLTDIIKLGKGKK